MVRVTQDGKDVDIEEFLCQRNIEIIASICC